VNLTVSQPIKILALVGLLAIAALGATTLLLGRSHPSTSAQAPTQIHHRRVATTKTATPAAPHAHAKPAHAKSVTPATKAPAATHTRAKPAAPKRYGNLVYADLPAPLQWQLALHKIVVVSLYDPNADVDAISVAEAHAGAVDAGAGFLLVSVLDNKVAGILTALLPGGGLLPAPGILVYRAPGELMVRLDGFADRTSVAQAVTNALAGQKTVTPATSTTVAP
jgi:hypothetical protein